MKKSKLKTCNSKWSGLAKDNAQFALFAKSFTGWQSRHKILGPYLCRYFNLKNIIL
jgi:hypothetical protein